ncbi:hypothetical protein [Spirilliplanes yamanashiensis]|uniref:Lipoprotein n=1 Tax=Spirilliplanes yamanashiensis TaxID=42233 RepID=A0A8J3YDL1_9ACTN|nr:hypothetical protein [Spirilliplanes yamanashiensis]MDP9816479.1 hypothetical protein [Spirilliplanes yamanashiensis]GIJ06005.1 hypothetical protein Sya03_53570 [Spirilliplanes yamanashiensis]
MRRLLVAAASGAVLLLGAGCSTDPAATPDAAPAPTNAAAPTSAAAPAPAPSTTDKSGKPVNAGDAALASNTGAICGQANKVSGVAAASFARESGLLADSKGKPEAQRVEERVQRGLEGWAFALRDLGNLTDDAALKKALGTQGDKVQKLSEGDLHKIKESQLTAIGNDVEKACAGK